MALPVNPNENPGVQALTNGFSASKISDLVADSKIQTHFIPGTSETWHVRNVNGRTARNRRLKSVEIWERKGTLGSGTFGTVYLEERVDAGVEGAEYHLRAVKEIRKGVGFLSGNWHRELEAIAKFSHGKYVHCFVESFGWFEKEETVFLAMEYFNYGDLQGFFGKPFPEPEAREVTRQIIEGLSYMHENGFVHRDLKPKNVLVRQPGPAWFVKIGDFGISKRLDGSTALRTQIGTEGYMSPELVGVFCPGDSRESKDFTYTSAVDIWAAGELTHRMLTPNKPAFEDSRQLFDYVVHGADFPVRHLEEAGTTMPCRDFVRKALSPSPRTRLTAQEGLGHEWMSSHELLGGAPFLHAASSSSSASSATAKPFSIVPLQPRPMTDFEPSAAWTTLPREIGRTRLEASSTMSNPETALPSSFGGANQAGRMANDAPTGAFYPRRDASSIGRISSAEPDATATKVELAREADSPGYPEPRRPQLYNPFKTPSVALLAAREASKSKSNVDWIVTPKFKKGSDTLFDSLDLMKKGYLTGTEGVHYFNQLGLEDLILAKIWDLADVNNSGTLNRDTFAIAMYLISVQLKCPPGVDALPRTLPQNFLPPYMRKGHLQAQESNPFD